MRRMRLIPNPALQWGRVLMGPETMVQRWRDPRDGVLLQWGRVLMGPETAPLRLAACLLRKELQWGRVLMGPETRHRRVMPRPTNRFNGAGS